MSNLVLRGTITTFVMFACFSMPTTAAMAQEQDHPTPLELAKQLEEEGKLEEARPVLTEGLQVLLSSNPADTVALLATARALAANIDLNRRFDDDALEALLQTISWLESLPDRRFGDEIRLRRTVGVTYSWDRLWAASEEYLTATHEMATETHGSDDLRSFQVLAKLANIWLRTDRPRGIAEYESMVASLEEQFGPTAAELAPFMNSLGVGYIWNSEFLKAVDMLERSVAIHKATNTDPAAALSNLSGVYSQIGELAKAREASEASLEVAQAKAAPGEFTAFITQLINVAQIQEKLGDFDASLKSFEWANRAPSLGPTARWRILEGIGLSMSALGMEREAELKLREALAVDSSQSVIRSLGDLYLTQGRLAESMENFEFLLNAPSVPADRATYSLRMAEVAIEMRDWSKAQSSLDMAAVLLDSVYVDDHPDIAQQKLLSSRLAAFQDQEDKARQHAVAAAELADHFIDQTLPVLSFAEQKGVTLDRIPMHVSALLGTGNRDDFAGYDILFGWKGLLTHSLRRQRSYARHTDSAEHAEALEDLGNVRSNLGVLFRQADRHEKDAWIALTDSLTARKEALERQLALAVGGEVDRDPLRALGLDGFQATLGEAELVVDVFRFADHLTREGQYAAVLTSGALAPRIVNLGASDSIDSLMAAWRTDVLESNDSRASFASLLEMIWKPIRDEIPKEVSRIWISPDAELTRLPWSEAAGPDGYSVSIIDDVRSLIMIKSNDSSRPVPRTALLVGGIDYEQSGLEALPGTLSELQAIKVIGDRSGFDISVLTDTMATSSNVLEAISEPSVVHIATHGFFEGESQADYQSRGTEPVAAPLSAGARRNPLLGSGLILAASPDESDALTAEDLIGLDMNSDIVVLSACDTGRGQEITGQGVQGLRSALFASGVRSILMSLWKVPDEPTALLMTNFYDGIWLDGLSKDESLRRAKDIVRAKFPEPVNWAAWVLAGDIW